MFSYNLVMERNSMHKCKRANKKIKVQRSTSALLKKLLLHLKLLNELSDKAFYECEHEDYLGEVAGKLRVLVIETRTNKPLLINLMHHFEYERAWINGIGVEKTLRTFMYGLAVMHRDACEFSYEKTIRYLSQQSGGSHEDWELDPELHYLLYEDRSKSCDSPYIVRIIRNTVNVVLSEATMFLLYLHNNNILREHGIEYNIRQLLQLDTYYDHSLDWSIASREKKGIVNKLKPTKAALQKYDIMCLMGKQKDVVFNIPGITPKEEFRINGPKEDMFSMTDEKGHRKIQG